MNDYKGYCLLNCDATQFGRQTKMCQKNMFHLWQCVSYLAALPKDMTFCCQLLYKKKHEVTVFSYIITLGAKGSTEIGETEALYDRSHIRQTRQWFSLATKFYWAKHHYLVHQWNTKQVSSVKLVCHMYLVKTLSHLSEVLIFFSYYIWKRDSTFKWALSSSLTPEHN